MYAQTIVGLLCCVGSGSNVASAWRRCLKEVKFLQKSAYTNGVNLLQDVSKEYAKKNYDLTTSN